MLATADQLHAVLGIKKKTLQQWAYRGLVKRVGRDRYDVESVTERWRAQVQAGQLD